MNKLYVTGGLGRDSELKTTPNGKMVLGFSLAVNTGWGDNKKTTWWNCQLWGDRAEKLQQYFLKGKQFLIEGEPSIRKYEKKDGSMGFSADLKVIDFEFMNGKSDNHEQGQSAASKEAAEAFGGIASDGVPF